MLCHRSLTEHEDGEVFVLLLPSMRFRPTTSCIDLLLNVNRTGYRERYVVV